jgi:hypothetical protein
VEEQGEAVVTMSESVKIVILSKSLAVRIDAYPGLRLRVSYTSKPSSTACLMYPREYKVKTLKALYLLSVSVLAVKPDLQNNRQVSSYRVRLEVPLLQKVLLRERGRIKYTLGVYIEGQTTQSSDRVDKPYHHNERSGQSVHQQTTDLEQRTRYCWLESTV